MNKKKKKKTKQYIFLTDFQINEKDTLSLMFEKRQDATLTDAGSFVGLVQ